MFHFHVIASLVYCTGNIGNQGPRSCGPYQKIGVFPSGMGELDYNRVVLHFPITQGHFVR